MYYPSLTHCTTPLSLYYPSLTVLSLTNQDQESKKQFAVLFSRLYPALMRNYINDDHEHTVCACSNSVQIFTVPTLVCVYTLCLPSVYLMSTLCLPYVYIMSTLCLRYVYLMSTILLQVIIVGL